MTGELIQRTVPRWVKTTGASIPFKRSAGESGEVPWAGNPVVFAGPVTTRMSMRGCSGRVESFDGIERVARHRSASTNNCTQLTPGQWHDRMDEKILADAIADRITTNAPATVLYCDDSMREHFNQLD